ncbi:MAG: lipid-A-disaccharide synthase [Candidatus Omnitrophica bacterium]|nr:lipid-A-disaccharide synthase [Candidatus Omnitrophota bacterium]
MKHSKNIFIIAGEPSGDVRGAELLAQLKRLLPGYKFWGIGGDNMQREGCELIEHIGNFSVIGVSEALKGLKKIFAQLEMCRSLAAEREPSASILIDYPGFNLKLAKLFRGMNIPVVYYIIPQVWAWGEWRVKDLARYADRLLVLFKFEKNFLAARGVDSAFVGHPLVESVSSFSQFPASKKKGLAVALLPGSRKSEVTKLLPILLASSRIISERTGKDVSFILAENSNVDAKIYDGILWGFPGMNITRVKDDTLKALSLADYAVVASGTATLETALMLKPFVIVYKSSLLTAVMARLVLRFNYIGLANVVAGRKIIPEYLEYLAHPKLIAGGILRLMTDDTARLKMIEELKGLKETLGPPGAAERAAREVMSVILGNVERKT